MKKVFNKKVLCTIAVLMVMAFVAPQFVKATSEIEEETVDLRADYHIEVTYDINESGLNAGDIIQVMATLENLGKQKLEDIILVYNYRPNTNLVTSTVYVDGIAGTESYTISKGNYSDNGVMVICAGELDVEGTCTISFDLEVISTVDEMTISLQVFRNYWNHMIGNTSFELTNSAVEIEEIEIVGDAEVTDYEEDDISNNVVDDDITIIVDDELIIECPEAPTEEIGADANTADITQTDETTTVDDNTNGVDESSEIIASVNEENQDELDDQSVDAEDTTTTDAEDAITTDVDNPETGDNANVGVFIAILIVAGISIVAIVMLKEKKKN